MQNGNFLKNNKNLTISAIASIAVLTGFIALGPAFADHLLTKELGDCPDNVLIKLDGTQTCDFTLQYAGPLVNVTDAIPAEWEVVGVSGLTGVSGATGITGTCTLESANNGTPDPKEKKAKRSATVLECTNITAADITFDLETRKSPSGKDKWKPTSCGLLYVNDGAIASTLQDGVYTLVDETGALVLLASNDPENDDCDGDGLTDAEEFNADPMTDPGNPDTDGDGLLDNEDAEPTTFNDSDGDGVGDGFDVCPGHDDNVDADGDGTPAGCDADDTDDTVQ